MLNGGTVPTATEVEPSILEGVNIIVKLFAKFSINFEKEPPASLSIGEK